MGALIIGWFLAWTQVRYRFKTRILTGRCDLICSRHDIVNRSSRHTHQITARCMTPAYRESCAATNPAARLSSQISDLMRYLTICYARPYRSREPTSPSGCYPFKATISPPMSYAPKTFSIFRGMSLVTTAPTNSPGLRLAEPFPIF